MLAFKSFVTLALPLFVVATPLVCCIKLYNIELFSMFIGPNLLGPSPERPPHDLQQWQPPMLPIHS